MLFGYSYSNNRQDKSIILNGRDWKALFWDWKALYHGPLLILLSSRILLNPCYIYNKAIDWYIIYGFTCKFFMAKDIQLLNITVMCVHFDIAPVGYRCIYWPDLLHDFVDPCGKFHLPLTCFHLYIVSSGIWLLARDTCMIVW